MTRPVLVRHPTGVDKAQVDRSYLRLLCKEVVRFVPSLRWTGLLPRDQPLWATNRASTSLVIPARPAPKRTVFAPKGLDSRFLTVSKK